MLDKRLRLWRCWLSLLLLVMLLLLLLQGVVKLRLRLWLRLWHVIGEGALVAGWLAVPERLLLVGQSGHYEVGHGHIRRGEMIQERAATNQDTEQQVVGPWVVLRLKGAR